MQPLERDRRQEDVPESEERRPDGLEAVQKREVLLAKGEERCRSLYVELFLIGVWF
jgi:hypothetical protein